MDGNDEVHLTWSNNSGPQNQRVFEYVRLDVNGVKLYSMNSVGGDDIIGFTTGFVVLRFFNDTRAVPDPYGPLSMLTFTLTGTLVQNLTVGYHKRTFEQADFLRNGTGSVFIVYMMDEKNMNMSVWQNLALNVDQKTLLQQRVNMKCPRMSFDSDGDIQLVWIDGTVNVTYIDAGIWRMRLDRNGVVLAPAKVLAPADRTAYLPSDLAILSTKGYDDFPVLARGVYTDGGSGGDQIPEYYFFIQATKDGKIEDTRLPLINYCSGNTPAMVQTGDGLFSMFYGVKGCFHESGDPGDPPGLYFLRSFGYHFIDLAVAKADIKYPDRTFPNEPFAFNVTVHNLGDWTTTAFTLNVTDKATDLLLASGTRNLGAGANYTFNLSLDLHKAVTLVVSVDPMTNPDVNLSNNRVEVPITPIARPDLAVFTDNITFSNVRPNKGQSLEVSALISNLGGLDAGAKVLFFDGVNGPKIGQTAIHFNTSSTTTSIFWAPAEVGVRTVIVRITNITPSELPGHSGNNEANRTLLVGSRSVPSVQILHPDENAKVEIGPFNITGIAWDIDNESLQVYVRVDGGIWEQATTKPNATVKGVDWFILWDFSDTTEGNHTIAAQVKDDIHQNDTLCHVRLVKYLVPFTVPDWTPHLDPTINETESQLFQVLVGNPHSLNIIYEWTMDGEVMNTTSKLNVTTTYEAAGTYNVSVNVTWGDFVWHHSWKLTVKDKNRPPVLTSHSPTNDSLTSWYHSTAVFVVNVTDPDGDALNYVWTSTANVTTANQGQATITFFDVGNYYVNVTVSDGRGGVVNHSWKVLVKAQPKECCLPPRTHTNTWMDNLFLMIILVIGSTFIVLLAVIYLRYSRKGKGKKGKGEPDVGDSPMEEELTPTGHIR